MRNNTKFGELGVRHKSPTLMVAKAPFLLRNCALYFPRKVTIRVRHTRRAWAIRSHAKRSKLTDWRRFLFSELTFALPLARIYLGLTHSANMRAPRLLMPSFPYISHFRHTV